MKVLIFSHKSDIDGMGSAVLSKLAFKDVEYVLCETVNVQTEVEKDYNNKKIYIKNLLTKEMADVIVFLEKGNVVYE